MQPKEDNAKPTFAATMQVKAQGTQYRRRAISTTLIKGVGRRSVEIPRGRNKSGEI